MILCLRYRNNVERLSALFKDRPQDPLDLGVYWIEYVIRHQGASHLRSVGRKLNFLQYHSIDVIGAYAGLLTVILFLVYSILKFVCGKICCRSQNAATLSLSQKKTN